MKRRYRLLSLSILLVLAVFSLNSCSGLPTACTVNCGGGGGGNGSVIVTVTSTPSQTFSFPFLDWQILSVQLINSSGGAVTIVQGALPPVDFARLQTDSQFLGKALSAVPAGTYTNAKIQLAPSTATSYFYNSSSATLLGCASGAVCAIPSTVAGFGASTVTVPVNFTVAANSNTGFSLNFDLSKAVTSAGGMTFDFTQSGAITLSALPRTGQSTGLDSLQNFTGTVTATTSTSISMSSLSSDTRTFTMASNVEFDDPFTICTPPANFGCLAVNQNVSVDAVVNSDGTLTAYEVEFLDKSGQEAEGIIVTPVSNNQFKMVVFNGVGNNSFLPGTLATVTVNSASTYFADPKNLGVSSTPVGFQSSTDLVMGQTVMLLNGSTDFSTNTLSGYTRTLLRYSSIGGTVQTPSGTIFTLSGVSPFFTNLSTNSVSVQTFPNTTYDNLTAFSDLVTGANASVRGLYLNPSSGVTQPLLAAAVRKHL
jgi:Domain of unknown function (DUF5666)/Domain of unknown function (DUF4382)